MDSCFPTVLPDTFKFLEELSIGASYVEPPSSSSIPLPPRVIDSPIALPPPPAASSPPLAVSPPGDCPKIPSPLSSPPTQVSPGLVEVPTCSPSNTPTFTAARVPVSTPTFEAPFLVRLFEFLMIHWRAWGILFYSFHKPQYFLHHLFPILPH